MALRITKSTDTITVEQIITTVYSPPGIGKTSLGFTADDPLNLDFDHGSYRSKNRGDTVQVKSWDDVADIGPEDLKPYKSLVMDTAGRALDVLTTDIIAKNPKLGRGGALTLQGFGELKARFIAYTKLIRSFGLDLVLLVHGDEQRSGDDVIERIDVQGGSKNEVYKVSDLMGRLKLEGGKRVLCFDPTDTSFGKNPAGFAKFQVPDYATTPRFLGGIISDTKAALNKMTEEQRLMARELERWSERIGKAETVEEFNGLIPIVEEASEAIRENVKRLVLRAAKSHELAYDREAKSFKAKVAA